MFDGRIASKGERRRCWSGNQQASYTHKKCSNAIKLRKSDFHRKPCWLYRLHFAGSGSRPNVVRGWKTSFNHESREKKELQRHPKASRTTPSREGEAPAEPKQPHLGRARLQTKRTIQRPGRSSAQRELRPPKGEGSAPDAHPRGVPYPALPLLSANAHPSSGIAGFRNTRNRL